MTKNEIIMKIRTLLWDGKEGGGSGDIEVIIKDIHGGFRNGRWGMQGYALCLIEGEVYVRPWSNSHIHWQVRLEEYIVAQRIWYSIEYFFQTIDYENNDTI